MNYVIKPGDNLYEIAKKYNITLDNLIKNNPTLKPYNLVIGTTISIPEHDRHSVREKMREVWEQHVFWTRIVIISIVEKLKDEPDATARLLQNADDLANIYRAYYGNNVANAIAKLINDHLVIAANLVHAIINGSSEEVNRLNTQWYENAEDIADALSNINSYYNKEELKEMLFVHLDLTKEEAANRINKNYKAEINVFDAIEKEALMMSDYLAKGIDEQFHNRY